MHVVCTSGDGARCPRAAGSADMTMAGWDEERGGGHAVAQATGWRRSTLQLRDCAGKMVETSIASAGCSATGCHSSLSRQMCALATTCRSVGV